MNAKAIEAPASSGHRPAAEPGSVGYLVGAVALVVAVAVLILVFGVVRPPALPSMDAAGVTPPGGVAWTQWDERDECTALMVARADGAVDRLACEQELGDVIAWPRNGIVTFGWGLGEPQLAIWDPTTGAVARVIAASDYYGPSGSSVVSQYHRDGTLVVTLVPSGREVWRVGAKQGYDVRAGTVSPDGSWVAMVDSFDRLLIVHATGGDVAVWADGVALSWAGPIWEGTAIPDEAR